MYLRCLKQNEVNKLRLPGLFARSAPPFWRLKADEKFLITHDMIYLAILNTTKLRWAVMPSWCEAFPNMETIGLRDRCIFLAARFRFFVYHDPNEEDNSPGASGSLTAFLNVRDHSEKKLAMKSCS